MSLSSDPKAPGAPSAQSGNEFVGCPRADSRPAMQTSIAHVIFIAEENIHAHDFGHGFLPPELAPRGEPLAPAPDDAEVLSKDGRRGGFSFCFRIGLRLGLGFRLVSAKAGVHF